MLELFPGCSEHYESTLVFARKLDGQHGDAAGRGFQRDAWRACAEFGLLGLAMPEEYGGTGGNALSVVAAYDAFGYGCRDNGLAFSLSGQLLSCQLPLLESGSEELKRRYLPKIIAGELIAAHASSEPDSGSDVNGVRTIARRVPGGFRVSGTKLYSTLAPVSDLAIVLCRMEDDNGGLSEILLPRESYQVGTPLEKIGLESSPMGEIVLDDAFVPEENVLGGVGSGLMGFMATMEWERLGIVASSVGAMRRELDACVAYARERKQFGSPIGHFQAVSHRIAEMKRRHDTSRLLLYYAAYRKTRGRATMEASLAKLHVSESRHENAVDAVRIFGAYGCMKEGRVEGELRDAVPGLIYSGTSDIQRNTIARLMGVGTRSRES
jgi:alkylation response protein AidB-like acyl-CoA dehydrogenase